MSRVVYVDGRYVPYAAAHVHVEDRGYQFADGVYEVIAVRDNHFIDADAHLDRLDRSLGEVRIAWPVARSALKPILREVVRRNRAGGNGAVYLQVTRGVAPRAHAFPKAARSVLVVTARRLPVPNRDVMTRGVAVITMADLRWKRVDIKSISLLPNVLGKQAAIEAGADEAWLVDTDGRITEGTASNAWIVTEAGEVVTRYVDRAILAGITRQCVLDIAAELGLAVVERPFTVAEALAAREAFLTSTTSWVKPVVRIDGAPIGAGGIGPVSARLLERYLRHMAERPKERPAERPDHGG